jgi:murein DD-endopeptidase MepM/ murein hydrolase activator NlpD
MSRSSRLFAVTLLATLAFSSASQGQSGEENYYLFPIKPGIRNTLAGTMGELRSSHFHTGIDIRTGGRQGIPVQAAADGYISRIRVSGGGYGYSLYLKHPNGKTTVYAHLKSFRDEIEEYVKENQYRKQTFEINLFPENDQFVFSKGDTIALSGNTGSSGGPHLHFDLRDENQDLLNPLSYGFDEVIDTRSPFASTLAIQPFDLDSRISGRFAREVFKLTGKKNIYTTDTITAIGEIGLELNAWDKMDGTRFRTGINEISVTVDGELLFQQLIESWSFSRARSFYQHINYESLINYGRRYHKLYVDHGNNLKFYTPTSTSGRINIESGKFYNAEIKMVDSYGNESFVRFVIKGSNKADQIVEKLNTASYVGKIYKYVADSTTADQARIQVGSESYLVNKSYSTSNGAPVFLWDLRKALPEKISLNDTTFSTHLLSLVPSGKEYKVFNGHVDVFFNKRSLFDSLAFEISYRKDSLLPNSIVALGNRNIPLRGYVSIVLKPDTTFEDTEHTAIYQVYGKQSFGFVGGEWKEGYIEAQIRSFGEFTVLTDSVGPIIKPLIVNRDRIVFKLDDKLSGIKEINATLNGEWLLIAGDPKRKQYWAEKRNLENNYAGEFVLEVTDNANNKKVYKTKIR